MSTTVRIGLVGDKSERVRAHGAIPKALESAARVADLEVEYAWLPTTDLVRGAREKLAGFQGIWCVPGSPYASTQGALEGIRYARESDAPFVGTCGGFQHALIEIARDVAGIPSAGHGEFDPGGESIVHPLACTLSEEERPVKLLPGSGLAAIYGREDIDAAYHCSFGLNAKYRAALEGAGVRFTASDQDGDPRAFELAGHRFFLGTLFQFELAALKGGTPPVVVAFLRAAAVGRPRSS
jgi:CTP synthase (UTP-ammonia lyase)